MNFYKNRRNQEFIISSEISQNEYYLVLFIAKHSKHWYKYVTVQKVVHL